MRKLERRKKRVDVSELVVDHKSQHTHLGSTALVQFNSTLGHLCFLIKRVPTEVDGTVTEVTNEFVFASNILHDGEFKETGEGKNLKGAGNRNGSTGIPARSQVRELGSVHGDVTRKVDTGLVDQVSNNTKHADTSMLDLNETKTVELFLVAVSNKTKGIKETKRTLGTNLFCKGREGHGGRSFLRNRGKGSGGGEEGGENGRLHDDLKLRKFFFLQVPNKL
mmetsp:Transcript_17348/g.22555  ORF Transcript_17348/g.22555 Transcript_17348/m.22555 type:complete len:222 (+) Transcript_17348:116-781(+)